MGGFLYSSRLSELPYVVRSVASRNKDPSFLSNTVHGHLESCLAPFSNLTTYSNSLYQSVKAKGCYELCVEIIPLAALGHCYQSTYFLLNRPLPTSA